MSRFFLFLFRMARSLNTAHNCQETNLNEQKSNKKTFNNTKELSWICLRIKLHGFISACLKKSEVGTESFAYYVFSAENTNSSRRMAEN